jgi:hypothetical protein
VLSLMRSLLLAGSLSRKRLAVLVVSLITIGASGTSTALVVTLEPSGPAGPPQVRSIAKQGAAAGAQDQDFLSTIPTTSAAVAVQGDSTSTTTYNLSSDDFALSFEQQGSQQLDAAAFGDGFIRFSVDDGVIDEQPSCAACQNQMTVTAGAAIVPYRGVKLSWLDEIALMFNFSEVMP